MNPRARSKSTSPSILRQGIPVSNGLASGHAHVMTTEEIQTEDRELASGEETQQVRRFRLAVRRSRDEIQALKECLANDPEDPGIRVLDAHLLLLEDADLLKAVREGIKRDRRPAAIVLSRSFQELISSLEASDAEYFRARAADIRDVKRRILRHLEGNSYRRSTVPDGSVIVATELSPSDAATFDPKRIKGMVTDQGGSTSHAAILARSRGIPAVVGLVDLHGHVVEGDSILVDGDRGQVVVRPSPSELRAFDARQRSAVRRAQLLAKSDSEPAVTLDGHPIRLLANIEQPSDVDEVASLQSDGIGLFRTEFFYLGGREVPDEEGQFRAYRRVLKKLRPLPVTIRVLDVGGDKFASYVGTSRSDNPFLGVRGIRFLLGHTDILRTQLRAIFRASTFGKARVLFPMISSVEELRETTAIVERVREELLEEGHQLDPVPRGAMIEVPAAVTLADLLAREADFFAIGSNDLIQYTLAVDRGNQKVAYLYDPFHPAVLRALSATIEAASRVGVAVSSCGEMSGNIHGAAMLLGLGCTRLSMSPVSFRRVKDLVRHVRLMDLKRMAAEALSRATADEVRSIVVEALQPILREDDPPIQTPPPRHRRES